MVSMFSKVYKDAILETLGLFLILEIFGSVAIIYQKLLRDKHILILCVSLCWVPFYNS